MWKRNRTQLAAETSSTGDSSTERPLPANMYTPGNKLTIQHHCIKLLFAYFTLNTHLCNFFQLLQLEQTNGASEC